VHLLRGHTFKIFDELFNRVAGINVVEEVLERDAAAEKAGCAAQAL